MEGILEEAKNQTLSWLMEQPMDSKAFLFMHHAAIARILFNEILEQEVCAYAGDRYCHAKPHQRRYQRWGSNPGSARIDSEKVPVKVPRVFDKEKGQFVSLESYKQLSHLPSMDERLYKSVLLGLSTKDYQEVAQSFVDGFGLSQSTSSRRFIERSAEKIKAFEERSLAADDFIALIIDGKPIARSQVVIALGVTMQGDKIPVGFVEATTENSQSVEGLLKDLIKRGFQFDQGLLCIVDGSKGLFKAIQKVFGVYAQVHRCQWHKRENVVSYLPEEKQKAYRIKLQQAYELPNYKQAKSALMALHRELAPINRSAANSLLEGLEETLTLHRLGVFAELGESLKTTNCIENLNSQLVKYIRKVKYWQNSDQLHRWIASGLIEIEQRMRKISNYKKLYLLREALVKAIPQSKRNKLRNAA